jgi:UDP-glucose 4-epimerase
LLTVAGQPEAYESLIGSLKLDLSKAAATGWRPPITLDEGLRRALVEPEM